MIRRVFRFLVGRVVAWVFALPFVLFLPIPIAAQTTSVPFEHGNHAFRYVLYSFDLKPQDDLSQLDSDTILIVFGETEILDDARVDLDNFLNNKGGAVLIATDRTSQGKWQKFFQVEFRNQFVNAPPDLAYKNKHEACPRVTPTTVDDIPIFRGLDNVYTNKPVYFLNRSRGLKTLATFRDDCWVDDRGHRVRLKDKVHQPAAFAAAGGFGHFGQGRALILSDHSVFINEMMLQTDNDNFNLAFQSIHWLIDRGEGQPKRTRVLFLDEGDTITNFEVPLTLTDVPNPPIDILNHMLVKLEQENFFNRLILGNDPGRRMSDIIRVLTIVITTAITGFGCYRFLQARYRQEAGEPLFSSKLAQQKPDFALVTQRHLDMVKADNFWEAAHHLARDWFQTAVPGVLETIAPGAPRPALPQFAVDAGWWRRLSWEGRVKNVWRLAAGSPQRLTAAEFARFVTQLDEIKTAHTRGFLHFSNRS